MAAEQILKESSKAITHYLNSDQPKPSSACGHFVSKNKK